jgi:glycosyltransferase involved in cell wall biosynthesis
LRPTARSFRALLPLYPFAIESLDLREYDLVVSSSSAWAHGVIVGEDATHVCYCHNPFRYAWSEREATIAARPALLRPALSIVFSRWRNWDWLAAQQVGRYVANSQMTRARIERFWGREATIVYPPVETERFSPAPPGELGDYYIVLAELMAHKRIDVAVEAFNQLGRRLVIVGDGPEAARLHRMAGPTITFTGRVPDDEVADLLARSRALVVNATEEFGIAAVEAQAAGRPVIAYGRGGVRETVVDGQTGAFYEWQDPRALAEIVAAFDDQAVDPAACVANADRFNTRRFARQLLQEVSLGVEDSPPPGERMRRPLRSSLRPVRDAGVSTSTT